MEDEIRTVLSEELGDLATFGAEIPERYRRDWLSEQAVTPIAVIRPRTTEDVSRALRLCSRLGISVVPQGGMTGLVGGAQPVAGGVALSLDRMTAVEEIDEVMATVTVEAGATLGDVQRACEQVGLFLAVDLGARDSCQVGGVISTNAGGNRVIRYGMTRENVLGIEAVLSDGTIVTSLNKLLKNNAGYDLKQLLIGSEGTLGVVTRAVLRLHAQPQSFCSAFCGCADFAGVIGLLKAARSTLGAALTSFEVMWPSFYDFMCDGLPELRRSLAGRHGVYVLIEASGPAGQARQSLEDLLAAEIDAGHIADAVLPKSERETTELWAVRESVSEYGRLMGPLTGFDIGIPTGEAGAFVAEIEAALARRWPDVHALSYGHIGDSNLHLVVNVPSTGAHQPHDALCDLVFEAVSRYGGTISAEHGIGTIKRDYLHLTRSPSELEVMARLKRALDPRGILNPGKVLAPPQSATSQAVSPTVSPSATPPSGPA